MTIITMSGSLHSLAFEIILNKINVSLVTYIYIYVYTTYLYVETESS